jgi:hypothetical protein
MTRIVTALLGSVSNTGDLGLFFSKVAYYRCDAPSELPGESYTVVKGEVPVLNEGVWGS